MTLKEDTSENYTALFLSLFIFLFSFASNYYRISTVRWMCRYKSIGAFLVKVKKMHYDNSTISVLVYTDILLHIWNFTPMQICTFSPYVIMICKLTIGRWRMTIAMLLGTFKHFFVPVNITHTLHMLHMLLCIHFIYCDIQILHILLYNILYYYIIFFLYCIHY